MSSSPPTSQANEREDGTTPLILPDSPSRTRNDVHVHFQERPPMRSHSRLSTSSVISWKTGRIVLLAFIPVIDFAAQISATTTIDIVQRLACVRYLASHGGIDSRIDYGDPRCQDPGVKSWFSALITIVALTEGIGAFITSGLIGRFANKYGRRPLFLIALLTFAFFEFLLPISVLIDDITVQGWVQLVWLFRGTVVTLLTLILLINMIVVDITDVGERTATLLYANGLASLGRTPAYAIGGWISQKTGNRVIVFIISWAMITAVAIVFFFTLPESFGPNKQAQWLAEQKESEHASGNVLVKYWETLITPLKLLKILLPRRDEDTGKKNYQISLLTAAFFMTMLIYGYFAIGFLVYATSVFRFGSAKTGIALSLFGTFQSLWLLLVAPFIIQKMEPYYYQPVALPTSPSHATESALSNGNEATPGDQVDDKRKTAALARRDLHLCIGTFALEIIIILSMATTTNETVFTIAFALYGVSGTAASTMRSVASSSVSPLQRGETLAALDMVASIAKLTAPVLGVVMTLSIDKAPNAVFFIEAACVFISALLLFGASGEKKSV